MFRTNNVTRDQSEAALLELEVAGIGSRTSEPTGGRPRERWVPAQAAPGNGDNGK